VFETLTTVTEPGCVALRWEKNTYLNMDTYLFLLFTIQYPPTLPAQYKVRRARKLAKGKKEKKEERKSKTGAE
jgi:hypothetical protein